MAVKGYSTFPSIPRLESCYQIVQCHISDTHWRGLTPFLRCIFYNPSWLGWLNWLVLVLYNVRLFYAEIRIKVSSIFWSITKVIRFLSIKWHTIKFLQRDHYQLPLKLSFHWWKWRAFMMPPKLYFLQILHISIQIILINTYFEHMILKINFLSKKHISDKELMEYCFLKVII